MNDRMSAKLLPAPVVRSFFLLPLTVCVMMATASVYAATPITMDIRLMATDLLDELIYSWKENPPLPQTAAISLAEISAPVGLDDRFDMMVENRLYELLRLNPDLPVRLLHCSLCRRWLVKSTPGGTVMARGIDQPEVMQELAAMHPDRLALSLSFEAEGRELVLRAYLFRVSEHQEVVWAQAYSTRMTARRLLRDPDHLVSWQQAKEDQDRLLRGQDVIQISTRLNVRQFNLAGGAPVNVAPLLFLEQSIEAIPGVNRNLRTGLTFGGTSLKDSIEAWSVGGHVAQLMFRKTPSLVHPDFYWFFGVHYLRMRGPAADPFATKEFDLYRLMQRSSEPRATLSTWRLGFEAHLKYRLGANVFIENVPMLRNHELFKTEHLLGIPYHLIGFGMVIRW